jgi:flagellar biosynthesis protein FliR
MDISQYLIYGVPAVALVMGLVKVFREVGLPSKFAPIASVFIGVILGLTMASETGQPYSAGAAIGIALGLSSCGMYDVGKKAL